MAALDKAKTVLASIVSALLLWKPTIVVMFPGFIYPSDLSSVLLADSCINCSTQTVFVFCLLEVLIACVLINAHVVPALFGRERWQQFDSLKKRKLVGFLIKILVRVACAVQILAFIAPRFDLEKGLFAGFNVKHETADSHHRHMVQTCKDVGMDLGDAVALRAWTFARDDMMAVMVWELAFIPELPADAWLHHLFVILGVVIGSDGQLLASRAPVQPLVDGIALFLVLGAALAALVEAAVLMYHLNHKSPSVQARWMVRSIVVQSVIVLIFFVALPAAVALLHLRELEGLAFGLLALLVFLTAVEVKMILVKWAIVKGARRKAQQLALQASLIPADSAPPGDLQQLGGSFTHDLRKEGEISVKPEDQASLALAAEAGSGCSVPIQTAPQ